MYGARRLEEVFFGPSQQPVWVRPVRSTSDSRGGVRLLSTERPPADLIGDVSASGRRRTRRSAFAERVIDGKN